MRKPVAFLVLLAILGGAGYYAYSRNWGPSNWIRQKLGYSDDAKTTANVKSALGLSQRVAPFNITVQTQDSVVTLTGRVPSEAAKSAAGQIAQDTSGVREVKNEIAVDGPAQPATQGALVEDLEIRAAILQALSRSTELGGKSIDVKVSDRKVVLSGSVDTQAQRSGAEQVAGAADGVAAVTNELVVKDPLAPGEPPVRKPTGDSNADLAKRVKFELYETGAFDTLTIDVQTTDDGTVTLSGSVRTRAEQVLATFIAQRTAGAQKVVNKLQVVSAPPPRR
ncbi:MAG TPA: BON domain-containing protein [Blastocatellia bacterium]|jgi:hyperosmotically inducible protein|nr:BON domain-containing protein [Blastocatellia bacterium]